MQHINGATSQSLNSSRQTERAAQELSGLALQMERLVARYQLEV
jgi:methyl-accepting chemotaxis protein